jgi:hypothetical protein
MTRKEIGQRSLLRRCPVLRTNELSEFNGLWWARPTGVAQREELERAIRFARVDEPGARPFQFLTQRWVRLDRTSALAATLLRD